MTGPLAVGIDLVDIVRVERLLRRHPERALRRLLTEQEQSYCMATARPAQHVAARLAAKEASYKALQQAGNARLVGWLDSEVVLNAHGKPSLQLHGAAERAANHLGVSSAIMSLTHSDSTAAAVVILLGEVT
ncbi:MAG: holo-ACP synthase [Gemmatimonadetes bacterium]|nr:holo-ACP synthase [Gemmatimonadota bacterium]